MLPARVRFRAAAVAGLLVIGSIALSGCATSSAEAPATGTSDAAAVSSAPAPSSPSEPQVLTPDGWLEGLPLPDDAELVSLNVYPDGANLNAIWTVPTPAAEAAAAYGAKLGAAGLASLGTTETDGMLSTDYAGNGLTVNVVATAEGGRTGLLINASKG